MAIGWRLLAGVGALCVAAAAGRAAGQEVRRTDFSISPDWEPLRNRLPPDEPRITRQEFGYRTTQRAGGKKPGEIGGYIQRSATPATYAAAVETRTLKDKLVASGKFAVTAAENGSGALFGWFHDSSRGWRTPNSLAFRIDGNGGKYWVLFEYGTRRWRAGGEGTFEGRYQTTKTKPFLSDGTPHAWTLAYDPDGAQGRGEITFTLDGQVYSLALDEGHKADGAEFNRFGMFNQQIYGDGLEAFFDDLTVDGRLFSFDRDPQWIGVGNNTRFHERFVRPRHDFGHTLTSHAGGQRGEIGGIVWRDPQPVYYADKIGPLTLHDELVARGRLALVTASSDSAVSFGWFSSSAAAEFATHAAASGKVPSAARHRRSNVLGIVIEGPSRAGHYFRPEYVTAAGEGAARQDGPAIFPDGRPHTWLLKYDPRGASGSGQITFRLDDDQQTMDLAPGHKLQGAAFDRFGILGWQPSDGHHVEIYLDDLEYTARR